jgi:hypothetical protein
MSPVFVCTFKDKETVRMSCWQDSAGLDLHRGLKLARAAYVTRRHNRARSPSVAGDDVMIPPIVTAHFEDTASEPAVVLATYDAREIRAAGLERIDSKTAGGAVGNGGAFSHEKRKTP